MALETSFPLIKECAPSKSTATHGDWIPVTCHSSSSILAASYKMELPNSKVGFRVLFWRKKRQCTSSDSRVSNKPFYYTGLFMQSCQWVHWIVCMVEIASICKWMILLSYMILDYIKCNNDKMTSIVVDVSLTLFLNLYHSVAFYNYHSCRCFVSGCSAGVVISMRHVECVHEVTGCDWLKCVNAWCETYLKTWHSFSLDLTH